MSEVVVRLKPSLIPTASTSSLVRVAGSCGQYTGLKGLQLAPTANLGELLELLGKYWNSP